MMNPSRYAQLLSLVLFLSASPFALAMPPMPSTNWPRSLQPEPQELQTESMTTADYLEEIKQQVLYPCYRYMMQVNRLEGFVSVEQFYEYMKATDRVTRLAEATLLEEIRGKPQWARERVYQNGLNKCMHGVRQGRVR